MDLQKPKTLILRKENRLVKRKKEIIIGISILAILIAIIIGIKVINDNQAIDLDELTQVTVAVRRRKRRLPSRRRCSKNNARKIWSKCYL